VISRRRCSLVIRFSNVHNKPTPNWILKTMQAIKSLSLWKVKQDLIDGTISNTRVFMYFVVIIAVDNLQLAMLQIAPANPTHWTPYSVWGSLIAGAFFLIATFKLNGGERGMDYLPRYFSISAVVALWIAIPFQLLIYLANTIESIKDLDWFIPLIIFCTNLIYFSFVAYQIYDVASKSADRTLPR